MGRLLVILVGVAFALAACEGSPSDQQSENGGGQWLTYELERADEGWRVTGTKGPYIIS